MTGDISRRKAVELRAKLTGIATEFGRWLAEAGDGRPLRKHQTQLLRLTGQLGGLVEALTAELDQLGPDGEDVLEAGRDLQLRILEVHRVWDFYRGKLGLRYVEWFGEHLGALDEFAWACLRPAATADSRADLPAAAVKAPPMVFPSGEFSPFLHARDTPFQVQGVIGAPDSKAFLKIVTRLPVPVIGLPWSQLTRLPDAVLVAHEIGHEVERAFDLTQTTVDQLRAVQRELDRQRRPGWFGWLREIFADVYAVLVSGPAFVAALIDLLAGDPDTVAAEPPGPPWLTHPPAALRIALGTAVLDRVGFAEPATQLRAAWLAAFPAPADDPLAPFVEDLRVVVPALLEGRYPQFGGVALPAVATFTPQQHRAALTAVDQVCREAPMEPTTRDPRVLVAAARLAFERDPGGFDTPAAEGGLTPQRVLLDRITAQIDDQPRSLPAATRAEPTPDEDRAAGAALTALLDRPAGTPAAGEGNQDDQ